MKIIDTHTHLYLEAFNDDRNAVVERAIANGVRYMLLPNIDKDTVGAMLDLCADFPENCFPMMGLHPTSVKQNFREHLDKVEYWLEKEKFTAIGETGIDLYWDKTYQKEQEIAFRRQIELAIKYDLPLVIHARNSFTEIFKVLDDVYEPGLKGVFHCFTGNQKQSEKILGWGFKLGIGGVVTFKNSGLDKVVKDIGLQHMILETDSPYLSPAPFRGKRNESAYTRIVAEKLAEIKGLNTEEVAEATTRNAMELFKIA